MSKAMYTAAWLSAESVVILRSHGIAKGNLHMTTFFDGYEQLKWLIPAPWPHDRIGIIECVTEWNAPSGKRLLVAELHCPGAWSHKINQWYRAQGAREDLPHKPHITLAKRVPEGAAAGYQALKGVVLFFDRHGYEL